MEARHNPTDSMRIGLNLLYAMPEVGGSWNYIENLLVALDKFADDHEFVAFVTPVSERLVPASSRFSRVRCGINPSSRFRRIICENTWLQVVARRHNLDCMHWFANTQGLYNSVPAVVTMYDTHVFVGTSKESQVKQFLLRQLMRMTARRAPVLLPMSHATAAELERHLRADPKRMMMVRVILEPAFQPCSTVEVTNVRRQYSLPDRFWIYVAHYKVHKNHAGLLEAYRLLKVGGYRPWPLVLRGDDLETSPAIRKQILEGGLASDIMFLPRVARELLPALYSAASAQVYPSFYEGGGIPVLEALACGCPVISSRLPAFQECVGDSIVFFDSADVQAIADTMRKLQDNAEMRQTNRLAGLERAKYFRAEYVVPNLVDAYRVAARHRS